MAVAVVVLAAPVVADCWVYAWRLPDSQGGLTVTCEHSHHRTAPAAVGCRDRLRVETEVEPWMPLGPRPAGYAPS